MSEAMRVIYDYIQGKRLLNYLDRYAHQRAAAEEEKSLDALKEGMNEEQLVILERYQEAAVEKTAIEMEAMFQAAFIITRELP